jgi:hypothetical protein
MTAFRDHLDDMPSLGWGYALLKYNQTQLFHAMLEGHNANYISRGSFFGPEQLSIPGHGFWREYFRNASPTAERDVDFCVPSVLLSTTMAKWQLVFEPFDVDQIDTSDAGDAGAGAATGGGGSKALWLLKAAPKRWFTLPVTSASAKVLHGTTTAAVGGFAVTDATTSFGAVDVMANSSLLQHGSTTGPRTDPSAPIARTAVTVRVQFGGVGANTAPSAVPQYEQLHTVKVRVRSPVHSDGSSAAGKMLQCRVLSLFGSGRTPAAHQAAAGPRALGELAQQMRLAAVEVSIGAVDKQMELVSISIGAYGGARSGTGDRAMALAFAVECDFGEA